jgi:hypothetical protein
MVWPIPGKLTTFPPGGRQMVCILLVSLRTNDVAEVDVRVGVTDVGNLGCTVIGAACLGTIGGGNFGGGSGVLGKNTGGSVACFEARTICPGTDCGVAASFALPALSKSMYSMASMRTSAASTSTPLILISSGSAE